MFATLSILGALAVAASVFVSALEPWGPFFALCAAGAAQMAWLLRREQRV